ncbi:DNA cytosine methyltransferase [Methanobrevibacter sp. DSM 116169]|uniref:DNA cytosine methyltransferase n=1 Tax=Methanobrevibacter sp. DSM 116169 TaxID=3242727 RepID=UPI0038FC7F77
MKSKLTVIDLFCGIGGFSKGFEMAGFDVILGIDNWNIALDTFKKNHNNTKIIEADLTEIDDKIFYEYENKIDVIIAGPPCQGFSMCGKRDTDDERNELFNEVIKAVKIIKPEFVIIENVVGLLSMDNVNGESVKDIIKKELCDLGYDVEYSTLNAADYGVPQNRKRVFFIGSKNKKVNFPKKLDKIVTVGDALSNIPDVDINKYDSPKTEFQKLMSEGEKNIYNHDPMNHNKNVLNRIKHVPPGGNWKDIPPEVYDVKGNHSNNYKRLDPNKPSITIKHAIKSMIIHPNFDRVITAREAARLQSFPDSFVIEGNKTEQHQQLANAVPPLLGYSIANELINVINNKNIVQEQSTLSDFSNIKKNKKKIRFIDLFSGIGGFRIAFTSIGGECVFSSDIDKWANETYFENFGIHPEGDIAKINEKKIPDHDILCAGFPCQPFSIGGYRKGFCDTRGTLFFEIERIIKEKKPAAFLLENVKGLTNHDDKRTFETIKNKLRELGYIIFYDVLNSKDYGIPQNRERIYIVGFKNKNVSFKFPAPKISDVNAFNILEKNVKNHDISNTATKHLKKHYEELLLKKQINEKYPLFAYEIRPSRCSFRNDGCSPCLTAKMGTGGNNVPILVKENRKLTTKECLRLQGFPENFKIKENYSQSYKQIGNSVSVPVIKLIAEEIVKCL